MEYTISVFNCYNRGNAENDLEMIKSIYSEDEIELKLVNENTISFKLYLKHECEIDDSLIELINIFGFAELMVEKDKIGLPYNVEFTLNSSELLVVIKIFWMKKNTEHFLELEKQLKSNSEFEDSIFFNTIENIKALLTTPNKDFIVNWLSKIKEETAIYTGFRFYTKDDGMYIIK